MSDYRTENFAVDILEAAAGEPIEAIVVSQDSWGGFNTDEKDFPVELLDKVLTWEEASPHLYYKYDSGYGAPDCHSINAWTASKVIFVSTYDGSTNVTYVPRNPIGGQVGMPGGG